MSDLLGWLEGEFDSAFIPSPVLLFVGARLMLRPGARLMTGIFGGKTLAHLMSETRPSE